MQLDVRVDLRDAERYLTGLRKDQIPFATAYALTQTAKQAQKNIVDTMQLIPVPSYGGRPTGTARLSDWVTFLDEAVAEDQIDGSQVLGRYLAGDLEAIVRHLIADVQEVRTLHRLVEDARGQGRHVE